MINSNGWKDIYELFLSDEYFLLETFDLKGFNSIPANAIKHF